MNSGSSVPKCCSWVQKDTCKYNYTISYPSLPQHVLDVLHLRVKVSIVNMGRLYSSCPCKCCCANWEGVLAIHTSAVSSNTAHHSKCLLLK